MWNDLLREIVQTGQSLYKRAQVYEFLSIVSQLFTGLRTDRDLPVCPLRAKEVEMNSRNIILKKKRLATEVISLPPLKKKPSPTLRSRKSLSVGGIRASKIVQSVPSNS